MFHPLAVLGGSCNALIHAKATINVNRLTASDLFHPEEDLSPQAIARRPTKRRVWAHFGTACEELWYPGTTSDTVRSSLAVSSKCRPSLARSHILCTAVGDRRSAPSSMRTVKRKSRSHRQRSCRALRQGRYATPSRALSFRLSGGVPRAAHPLVEPY